MNLNFQKIKADANPGIATSGAQMEDAFNSNFEKIKKAFSELILEFDPDFFTVTNGKVSIKGDSPGGGTSKLVTFLLDRLKGKYLSILGDSVSSYAGTFTEHPTAGYYPIGDVDSLDKMWWKIICDQLGMNWLVNNSVSGSKITSGAPWSVIDNQRHLKLHTAERDPDIIFVEMGGNDIAQMTGIGNYNNSGSVDTGTNFTNFRDAYGKMLQEMKSRYTKASIYCCTLAYYPLMMDANPNVKMTIAETNDIGDYIKLFS
jgi:hypothetical protein